jgi:hypothetical protein
LFLGSSVEGLEVAYAIQENLEFDAEATIWKQGVFRPSRQTLSELITASERVDFAAFVFSGDDIVMIRGQQHAAVRDNVIFEMGLFMGALGVSRCFYIVPRDGDPLHLPTDLLGVAPLTYRSKRSDGNLVAALGTACNQIRRAFRAQITEPQSRPTMRDYLSAWDAPALANSRRKVRSVTLDPYSDEWADQREDFGKVFAFLESLSDAVLAGELEEAPVREIFGDAIQSFWPIAYVMLSPPNQADEWWKPPPKIAELHSRWNRRSIA